ncbi:entericidin A/B family lipoprotein [Paracoccus sp. DMF-8]|nr:entericidin A/B family lipoprotein [Paracoccus sp. DMF-8]MDF3607952.1 entericidin A/B family lipoprotein [Paracoccus sp. DMF-8]
MRRLLNLTPFLLLMAVAACETVQGAGRDLQGAGQAITQESRDVQSRM